MTVPNAHELAVTHDGKTAYVTCRAGNALRVVDLEQHVVTATIPLGPAPDTLQLSANEKLLTVGLRGTPAQVAIIDTETFATDIVTIGGAGTIAGHQWTSPTGTSRSQHSKGRAQASPSSTTPGQRDRPDARVSRSAARRRLRATLGGVREEPVPTPSGRRRRGLAEVGPPSLITAARAVVSIVRSTSGCEIRPACSSVLAV